MFAAVLSITHLVIRFFFCNMSSTTSSNLSLDHTLLQMAVISSAVYGAVLLFGWLYSTCNRSEAYLQSSALLSPHPRRRPPLPADARSGGDYWQPHQQERLAYHAGMIDGAAPSVQWVGVCRTFCLCFAPTLCVLGGVGPWLCFAVAAPPAIVKVRPSNSDSEATTTTTTTSTGYMVLAAVLVIVPGCLLMAMVITLCIIYRSEEEGGGSNRDAQRRCRDQAEAEASHRRHEPCDQLATLSPSPPLLPRYRGATTALTSNHSSSPSPPSRTPLPSQRSTHHTQQQLRRLSPPQPSEAYWPSALFVEDHLEDSDDDDDDDEERRRWVAYGNQHHHHLGHHLTDNGAGAAGDAESYCFSPRQAASSGRSPHHFMATNDDHSVRQGDPFQAAAAAAATLEGREVAEEEEWLRDDSDDVEVDG